MALQSTFIRTLYLYIFASVGLIILVIGSIQLIDLGLRLFVFTDADSYYVYPMRSEIPGGEQGIDQQQLEEYQQKEQTARTHRELSQSLAFILVGLPLFWFHVRIIRLGKEEV